MNEAFYVLIAYAFGLLLGCVVTGVAFSRAMKAPMPTSSTQSPSFDVYQWRDDMLDALDKATIRQMGNVQKASHPRYFTDLDA